ncbi:histamine H1 receptor [Synchiropus splendidus]|uniref:histamine H1 receptor n=1 Tax=Synchiropus splendidus TaxID=270530 RepID=UPI00237E145F|nr:histamine H1 receptor [Synchiropus splendidus]
MNQPSVDQKVTVISPIMMELDASSPTGLPHLDNHSCSGHCSNGSARLTPTVSPYQHVHRSLIGVSLGFLSILTVLMNLLVLYAVKKERSLHTVGNLYIVSLSLADLMVGSTVMPLNLVYLLDDQWTLGRAVCQFWLIMDYVASTASIFSLFILCLDRYRSVKQPLKYLKHRTRRKASAMISGAWLLSMMWIVPILGWRSFTHVDLKPEEENQCDTDFRFVTWFKVTTAVFNFYVPSILMLWFYSYIYLAVRQHLRDRERIIHPSDSFGENKREEMADDRNASHSPRQSCQLPLEHLLDQNTLDPADFLHDVEKKKSELKKFSVGARRDAEVQPQEHQEAGAEDAGKNKPQQCLRDKTTGDVCDVTQISDMQTYPSVLPDNFDRPEETEQDTANKVTLRLTWQTFVQQSRLRIQSLRIHKEHKAAKQLGFIIAAFLLCWIPYFIAFMVMAVCPKCVHRDLHMFTIWLGYINSTLNPFIYPLCNRNFKRVFKNILHIAL